MTQITRDQHYVPAFYFKRFAKEKQIQVFNVRAKRIEKPRHYGSMCRKEFFYAAKTGVQDEISQAFEKDVFGKIEDVFEKALPGIIERTDAQKLTNGDLGMLAYFMIVQWLRTPFFRERLQKIRSESGEYDLRETNNASHLNFIDEDKVNGFYNLLLAKKWRIILSGGPYHFITSDNPVAEWIPPRTGLIPVTFMDRRHLLALTPNILIETCRPDSMNNSQLTACRITLPTKKGFSCSTRRYSSTVHTSMPTHTRETNSSNS